MACHGVERCPFPRPISFSSQIVRRSKVVRLVLVPQLLLCQMIKLFVLTLRFSGLLPQLIGATDNIDVLWSCHVLPNLSRPPLAYRGRRRQGRRTARSRRGAPNQSRIPT